VTIPAAYAAAFNFTTIDPPGSTYTGANANSTNAIAGEYHDTNDTIHGFILSKGIYTTFDVPNVIFTQINGISANGSISGTYQIPATYTNDEPKKLIHYGGHAFFKKNGVLTTLDPPGSIKSQGGFNNAQGQAVGAYRSSDQKRHGFLWDRGNFITLNVPGDDPIWGTVAFGINDPGQIVGTYVDTNGSRHGFLLNKAGYTTLDPPDISPVPSLSVAEGINNAGQIVGFYVDGDGKTHGYILTNGSYTTIDVNFPNVTVTGTWVYSINAKGEVAGAYDAIGGGDSVVTHGFVGTPAH
jgi:probable HAF family extracellular repeat protein